MIAKKPVPDAALFPRTETFTARELFARGVSPFGEASPPRARSFLVPLPTIDPRTAALRVLRQYVASLVFYRPGGIEDPIPDKPHSFSITPDRFHLGTPDNIEEVKLPSVVVVATGAATFDSPGFVNDIDESSIGKFGPNTVLAVMYEQSETITLELWCGKRPELRSLMAGLQIAFNPLEQMYGMRFRMPEYYDETVVFTPVDAQYEDNPSEVVHGRRCAKLRLEMRFNAVAVVPCEEMKPQLVIETAEDADVEENL